MSSSLPHHDTPPCIPTRLPVKKILDFLFTYPDQCLDQRILHQNNFLTPIPQLKKKQKNLFSHLSCKQSEDHHTSRWRWAPIKPPRHHRPHNHILPLFFGRETRNPGMRRPPLLPLSHCCRRLPPAFASSPRRVARPFQNKQNRSNSRGQNQNTARRVDGHVTQIGEDGNFKLRTLRGGSRHEVRAGGGGVHRTF